MNKKAIAVCAAAFVFIFAAESSSAFTLYSEGKSAAFIAENYTEDLRQLNTGLYEAVKVYSTAPEEAPEATASEDSSDAESSAPQPEAEKPDTAGLYTGLLDLTQEYHLKTSEAGKELAGKLMDYDICLKKLKILISRYDARKENAERLSRLALTGECDSKEASDAKDEADSFYFDIKALLFDISVLKADIEGITGETLSDDFNFNSVYLITDALKIDDAGLNGLTQFGSLYVPEGVELPEYTAVDCTSQISDAVQLYYALGAALREYISAAAAEKEGKSDLMLGQTTAEELRTLTETREDCFLAAAQAKADLSKALIALDDISGNALTGAIISGEEANVLSGTLPEDVHGRGMWLAFRTSEGAVLCPVSYPAGTYPIDEEDESRYTYTLKYNGEKIGSAVCGAACHISGIEYKDGLNYAEIYFYRDGVFVGKYQVNIFTPYGKFE